MTEDAQVFDRIVGERRSMRIFDEQQRMDGTAVHRSLQRALLAPNSSNMQLWEFYRVTDPVQLKQIARYCMNQSAARTAHELVLVVVRRDKWRERAKFNFEFHKKRFGNRELSSKERRKLNYYSRLMPLYYFQDWFGLWGMIRKLVVFVSSFWRPVVWAVSKSDLRLVCHKSAALAAQTFMLSMQAEGYATCPMEGFDLWKVRRYLKLPIAADISMIIACGPGTEKGIYHERIRLPEEEVIFQL
jgi:nitroreductase